METASELRRSAYHLVGVSFVLALYCLLAGTDIAAASLAATGIAMLAGLTATGHRMSEVHSRPRDTVGDGFSEADDLQDSHEW